MLKKLISIFVLSFAMIPLLLVPACEDWLTYETHICEIEFYPDPERSDWFIQDSVYAFEEEIAFGIYASTGLETCWAPVIPFVNTAYATTPCARYQNHLLQSSFSLRLDRDITYENETIPAHTDLYQHPQIAAQIEVFISADCDVYYSQLTFSDALRNAITFQTGEYLVSFSCETSDQKALADSARVIFTL